jgi:hypothetical protein
MMKFFRKYNKQMLAVFMALLLVVWLGGAALTNLFHPDESSRIFANTRFGPLRHRDTQRTRSRTELLDTVGLRWSLLGGTPIDDVDWLLLVREADELGIHVEPERAEEFLAKNRQLDRNTVQQIARRRNVRADAIYDAVTDFMKVRELMMHMLDAASLSEAELRTAAREYFENVKIQAVVLSPSNFMSDDQTFTEDQIREQFNKGRDEQRGKGLSFGYFLPPKIKVQYVKVDHNEVQQDMRLSDSTLVRKARQYWDDNKDKDPAFVRPKDEAASTQPFAHDQPKRFQTFEEAQTVAMEIVRKQAVADEVERTAEAVIHAAKEPWFDTPAGSDGYKVAPDTVKSERYYEDTVIPNLPSSVKHKQALHVVTTDWFTQEEARTQAGIGAARVEGKSGAGRDFATLAFNVQGLAKLPNDPQADRSDYLSLYQSANDPFHDAEGNLYVLRVIGVVPAHAPESVDLVRDQVIADLKLKTAYEKARQAAETIAASARTTGLKNAWEADQSIRPQVQPPDGFVDPEPFPRRDPLGLQIGRGIKLTRPILKIGDVDDEFREACFALGDRPSGDSRVEVISQPQLSEVVAVAWLETHPMTKQQYQQNRDKLRQSIESERAQQIQTAWLSPDQIRARNGFQSVGKQG